MPVQQTKSLLVAKLGAKGREAHEAAKAKETVYDTGARLPAGIDGGVAQLVDCRFSQYEKGPNKGEVFYYAAGVVCEPKVHDKVKCEGLRTSVIEPVHDTPSRSRQTVQEHLDWVYNELRKLGLDTSSTDLENLEANVAALKAAKPYFTFRTWKGKKQVIAEKGGKFVVQDEDGGNVKGSYPTKEAAKKAYPYADNEVRVQEVWNGLAEYNGQADPGAAVDDKSGAIPTVDETTLAGATGGDAGTEGTEDVAALLDLCNANDADAQEKLQALSIAAGASKEDVDGAADWDAVAALITAGDASASGDGGQEWKPEVGDSYKYTPPKDPKNPKKAVKPVECEVKAVNEEKRTVNLLSNVDKKTQYKGVSWDALESATD